MGSSIHVIRARNEYLELDMGAGAQNEKKTFIYMIAPVLRIQ